MTADDLEPIGPAQRPLDLPGLASYWETRRETTQHALVLQRDGMACANCERTGLPLAGMPVEQRDQHPVLLEVHHLSYDQPARMSYLVTLCQACHRAWHDWPGISDADKVQIALVAARRARDWGER